MQEGVNQLKVDGQILKQMYPDAILQKVRSTDLDRTKISILSAYTQILSDNQLIHTGTTDFDPIVRPSNCSFDLSNRDLIVSTYNLTVIDNLKNETQNTDFTFETFCDAYRINNILNYTTDVQNISELEEACWILDDVYYQTSWNESQMNHNQTQKINVGPFANELVQLINNRTGTDDQLYLFSGHDVSLSPISSFFVDLPRNYQGQPDFASMLILEVDYDSQTVKSYYKGSINETNVTQYNLKSCNDIQCTFDEFYNHLQSIQVQSFEELVDLFQEGKQQTKVKRTDKNYKTKTAPAIKKSLPCQIDEQNAETFEQKTVHDTYEKIATHFSNTRNVPWPLVKNFILKYQQQNKPLYILDCGCGNGKYSKLFSEQNFNYAIDYSFNLCQINKQENKFVEVINADGLNLPFKDNIFDLTISIAVLHHLSTQQRRLQYIQELYRVMSKNSIGLISVWAYEQDDINETQQRDRFVPWSINPADQKRFNLNDEQNQQPIIHNRYYHFFAKNELSQLLKQAGFKILQEEGLKLYQQIYGETTKDDEYMDHDNWYCVFSKM